MRTTHIVDDIQSVILAVLQDMQTAAPWSAWDIIRANYQDVMESQITKPLLYVLPPQLVSQDDAIGGSGFKNWTLIIGYVTSDKCGGESELNIISSRLFYLFTDPSVYSQKFNVTLATAITDTTLILQGLFIESVTGNINALSPRLGEYASSITLNLRSN